MEKNSKLIIKSKHPDQTIIIGGSIWGPGTLNLSFSFTLKLSGAQNLSDLTPNSY
jgi:hypothetical protein